MPRAPEVGSIKVGRPAGVYPPERRRKVERWQEGRNVAGHSASCLRDPVTRKRLGTLPHTYPTRYPQVLGPMGALRALRAGQANLCQVPSIGRWNRS